MSAARNSSEDRLVFLPMYDFPALHRAHDALWSAICAHLRAAKLEGVPDRLARPDDLRAGWRNPKLLLGQTCGYPLIMELVDQVRLVATPIYRAPGCDGVRHCSAVIVNAGDATRDLRNLRGRRCAINSWDSNSGMNLLRATIAPLAEGAPFFGQVTVSGSHRQSLHLVAHGEADVAAIDCVTLAHLTRIEPSVVAGIRVLSWTPLSPALPMITATNTDAATVETLRKALKDVTSDPEMSAVCDTLLLGGFEVLPLEAYEAIRAFETEAAKQGYPRVA